MRLMTSKPMRGSAHDPGLRIYLINQIRRVPAAYSQIGMVKVEAPNVPPSAESCPPSLREGCA